MTTMMEIHAEVQRFCESAGVGEVRFRYESNAAPPMAWTMEWGDGFSVTEENLASCLEAAREEMAYAAEE